MCLESQNRLMPAFLLFNFPFLNLITNLGKAELTLQVELSLFRKIFFSAGLWGKSQLGKVDLARPKLTF